jgi:hypothetical protein
MSKTFDELAHEVAREYRKKGYSHTRAMEIGKATAGKAYWQAYRKKGEPFRHTRITRKHKTKKAYVHHMLAPTIKW